MSRKIAKMEMMTSVERIARIERITGWKG